MIVKIHSHLTASCLIAAILVSVTPTTVHAQAAARVLTTDPIPMGFRSYSLFLICNPRWILANGDEGIGKLFNAYTVFGATIGPENLALWFAKAPGWTAMTENTDIERMSTYCQKFGLLPSATPQVVTTTHHPDAPDVGGKVVASLSGSAENSALALTDLTDELLKTGISQRSLDVSEWGRRIGSAASTLLASTACYLTRCPSRSKQASLTQKFRIQPIANADRQTGAFCHSRKLTTLPTHNSRLSEVFPASAA
jgi:hypothetical protein